MAIKKGKELVLVTGGAGFIGSHLVDALVKEKYAVRVMDALLPPSHNGKLPEWFNKKAEFVRGDVRIKRDWEKALVGVSYVFHLAAYMDYHLDFSNYFRTNTESVALLYEVIVEKKLPIKKIIIASSQSVYGEGKYECPRHGIVYAGARSETQLKKKDWSPRCSCGRKFQKPIPQKEDDELRPQNPYGISKMALERIALNLGKEYAIPTVLVRYSIVHGARQSWRHFYSGALRSFVVQALAGETIEMHEDAGQTRDFVHIDDVTRAHMLLLRSPRVNNGVFNIGSGKKTIIAHLAKTVSNVLGASFRPDIKGIYRVGASRDSLMDVSKMKKLGWKPQRTLDDNVRDYIAWMKKYPEAIRYLHETYVAMKKCGIIR